MDFGRDSVIKRAETESEGEVSVQPPGQKYELEAPIGRGGMGEVFLAEDRRLSDTDSPALVALKIIRSHRDEFARRRFIEEAAKARRLDHPGAVRVFDHR